MCRAEHQNPKPESHSVHHDTQHARNATARKSRDLPPPKKRFINKKCNKLHKKLITINIKFCKSPEYFVLSTNWFFDQNST